MSGAFICGSFMSLVEKFPGDDVIRIVIQITLRCAKTVSP